MIPILNVKEQICLRGNSVKEDRIGADENYIFAIDGASGLNGRHVTQADSDAAWLAEGLRSYLCEHLTDTTRTIGEIVGSAAEKLRREYDVYWNASEQDSVDYPSAGVAIFRVCGDWLEYFGLGDCDAIVETSQGEILVLEEMTLPALDKSALSQMVDYAKQHGCNMLEARAALHHVLVQNRNLRNTHEGYWIFDPTGVGIPHARTARWPLTEVKGVAVASDGFVQLVEPFGVARDRAELYQMMKEKGLAPMAEELFALQAADPECMGYPRFKLRDDTSAVIAAVE